MWDKGMSSLFFREVKVGSTWKATPFGVLIKICLTGIGRTAPVSGEDDCIKKERGDHAISPLEVFTDQPSRLSVEKALLQSQLIFFSRSTPALRRLQSGP